MRAPEFWQSDGALTRLLAPLGVAYGLAGRLHRARARPVACGVPVVCIGNLVAGGAGKTPVALAVAGRLQDQGRAVQLLTRGYGGRARGPLRVDPGRQGPAEVGDEALLLAARAPTWVARDRAAGAAAAVAAGAEVLVMDDGFQNPALAKNLSLLVVDGASGFGNGRVMPAGPLREGLAGGLARAQGLVLLGPDRCALAAALGGRGGRLPLLEADLEPDPAARARLAGQRVLAFAGIGRPAKFFDSLRGLGAELVETRDYPDHHPYGRAEIEALLARAARLEARAVTTEKDRVRLPAALAARVEVLPVQVAWRDPAALDGLLAGLDGDG